MTTDVDTEYTQDVMHLPQVLAACCLSVALQLSSHN